MQNFGVREICDVVLKAKADVTIGSKKFFKNEPVILFDTLKTSSMEGAADTVYAEGGKGNTRLMAWEGNRTVTFTMEDALISTEGFMILSGADLIEASDNNVVFQHVIETTDDFTINSTGLTVNIENAAYLPTNKSENYAYVMLVDSDDNMSEPYIPTHVGSDEDNIDDAILEAVDDVYTLTVERSGHTDYVNGSGTYTPTSLPESGSSVDHVLVDYYVAKKEGARQIEITADKFGGNYYLEASTLFKDENGVDHPAEFIIPNCKVQSNFTFSMASTGDPSTFTFTMDAFPDYTRFDHSKKVLAALQVIDAEGSNNSHREATNA